MPPRAKSQKSTLSLTANRTECSTPNATADGSRRESKPADGKFWFPTQDGVVVINPEEVGFNPNPPPVQIESVLIERQPVDLKNGIELQRQRRQSGNSLHGNQFYQTGTGQISLPHRRFGRKLD